MVIYDIYLYFRLVIKTCSLYPTHWIGKDHCLLSSGDKLVLMRENNKDGDNEDGDQHIQIRCKRPETSGTVCYSSISSGEAN